MTPEMRFRRSPVVQASAEHHGDPRLHAELHAARESHDSDRLDGDAEQQQPAAACQQVSVGGRVRRPGDGDERRQPDQRHQRPGPDRRRRCR